MEEYDKDKDQSIELSASMLNTPEGMEPQLDLIFTQDTPNLDIVFTATATDDIQQLNIKIKHEF